MEKRFYSRKNNVTLWHGLVRKRVASAEKARAEAVRLRALRKHGLAVPRVIWVCGCSLFLEYIKGETVTDALTRIERIPFDSVWVSALAQGFCDWLADYFRAVDWQTTGRIPDDVNCRNFLLTPQGEFYGIDFETDACGAREEAVGKLLAFLGTYEPAETPLKRRLCEEVLARLVAEVGLSSAEILREQQAELERMKRRRARKMEVQR